MSSSPKIRRRSDVASAPAIETVSPNHFRNNPFTTTPLPTLLRNAASSLRTGAMKTSIEDLPKPDTFAGEAWYVLEVLDAAKQVASSAALSADLRKRVMLAVVRGTRQLKDLADPKIYLEALDGNSVKASQVMQLEMQDAYKDIHQHLIDLSDECEVELGSSPREVSKRQYTVADLRNVTGLATTSVAKFRKLAKVKAPPRGKKNHQFTEDEVRRFMMAVVEHCSVQSALTAARGFLAR